MLFTHPLYYSNSLSRHGQVSREMQIYTMSNVNSNYGEKKIY